MRALRPLLAAGALLALGACAAISNVPPGPMKVGSAEVTLGRDWSDISTIMTGSVKKVRVLSIDGPLLNRLYVTDGLSAGEALIKAPSKDKPTPTLRDGMNSSERMEFVADSVAAMGYQRVETQRPRPAKFGEAPAVRFDISARTEEGLDVLGTAMAAEAGGKTYFVLYLAPAEHYYQASLAEVEKVIASARPGD
ncbi:MAG: hypothetical protein ACOY5Y_06665 [Pseudomonadota bacterium]|jgi:hypothetical protein